MRDATPKAFTWVRKRDGSVVAFDAAKLVSSIYAAREQLDPENAAFHAQELSEAVLHFLAEEFEGRTPTTFEISETVVKVLREMGQGPTAALYDDRQQKRRQFRERELVASGDDAVASMDAATRKPVAPAPETWDKARIVWSLQTEADVDATTARDIAAAVERRLLAWDLGRIPTSLVDELIDCELLERGMQSSLRRRRLLGVPSRGVEKLLSSGIEPDQIHRLAGREILRQFALQEVYSRDVAGLHEEGLLHLYDAACPGHWAAVAVDALEMVGNAPNAGAMLTQFESQLEEICRRVEGAVAIDCLDSVFALEGDRSGDPVSLADGLVETLRRAVRGRQIHLVVNLFGRVLPSTAEQMSDGPLFKRPPNPEQNEFAHVLALEIGARVAADARLSQSCRIDFHPDLKRDSESFDAALRPWLRWVKKSAHIAFSFDRHQTPLAEGLSRSMSPRSAVYQYVGIRMPLLLHRLAHAADDEAFMHRLGLLCSSAVRAGLQKREFLRRQQPEFFSGRDSGLAALVVVPIGLDAAAAKLMGSSLTEDEAALGFAEQIIARCLHSLRQESRHYQLRCVIDGLPGSIECEGAGARLPSNLNVLDPTSAEGLSAAQPGGGPRRQIYAAGKLHALSGHGTCLCRLPAGAELEIDQLAGLVTFAAHETSVCRVRFLHPSPEQQSSLDQNWLLRR